MKPALDWLDRDTVIAPHMALCLDEATYLAAAQHCKVKDPALWLASRNVASVHTWSVEGQLICVVCLNPEIEADPIGVAGALVHEAVHVFQRLCDSIGEHAPGNEFEAYSIERIAKQLMRSYVRQMAA
jgi:hypothetical protein